MHRCTRISNETQLHQHALASCKAGELCKIRTYADDSEFKSDGTPQRYLLKLGKRESSVCVRIYDKGLETKTLPPHQWERVEVEFKDERATEVCMKLVDAGDQICEVIWRYVIGAVDFRAKNGRTELLRRPQAEWWDEYVGHNVPIITKPIKKACSFESWCSHFRVASGARLIQLSNILCITPHEFFEILIEGLDPATTIAPATIDAKNYVNFCEGNPSK